MAETFLLFTLVLICLLPYSTTQYTSSCSSSQQYKIRLYNTRTNITEDGSVQMCYSRTWYAVCDYRWDCSEANVACKQLGYDKARSYTRNSDGIFGYWSYIRRYYYSCSGTQNRLSSCTSRSRSSSSCRASSDEAGVRCIKTSRSQSCNATGSLHLTGGNADNEGVLEYCYYGTWSAFCYLDNNEAAVACKQLGYSQYAVFLSSKEYKWNFPTKYTGSMFNSFTCSSHATENSLSQCTLSTTSSSSCGVNCLNPKAIRCLRKTEANQCTDGALKLADGSIAQEGRIEVCVDGVWGSVCGSGWTKQAAYVVCKQLGYIYSEPVISTNSKYGNGQLPIVYANIQCGGWERSISSCTKTDYLHFSCSSTAGVLCQDDCTEGSVRLVGGSTANEGTVEICKNSLWGLITDAGWSENDAKVTCKQLNLPFNGAYAVHNSHYGKPDRAIHYSYVLCDGDESAITSCGKITHTLTEGRSIFLEAVVAGVVCRYAPNDTKPIEMCVSIPEETKDNCKDGDLNVDERSGTMQYCTNGVWSSICSTLTHNETTVACRQLGYTTFTWGQPFDVESVSSSQDFSLISNISCASTEDNFSECTVNKQKNCLKYCGSVVGLNCYKPGKCIEGSVRLANGTIEQEGRVEICVNGVWGSICGDGWDKTDALVICQQLGYPNLEPLAYRGDTFGSSTGPLLYSDVNCGGWEKSIEECKKRRHLEIQCSHTMVAGVTCSDGCSNGDIRLVGSRSKYEGTVEVCYNTLWGLIEEDGWGLSDAIVVCRQLGFEQADNSTTGSLFGKPNKVIHISQVKCDGSEISIDQCSRRRYSIAEGKAKREKVNVAGVICHKPFTSQSLVTTATYEKASSSVNKVTLLSTASQQLQSVVVSRSNSRMQSSLINELSRVTSLPPSTNDEMTQLSKELGTTTTNDRETPSSTTSSQLIVATYSEQVSILNKAPSSLKTFSSLEKPQSSLAALADKENNNSLLLTALVGVFCSVIVVVVAISVAVCVYISKTHRNSSQKHTPPVVSMSEILQNNQHDYGEFDIEDIEEKQIKIKSVMKGKSNMKDEEMDTTVQPASNDYQTMHI